MRPLRYPLEPLAHLRAEQVDAAVRGLASAVAARDGSERERLAAEELRDSHAATVASARQGEAEALQRGELRAADLACAGAWETRVARETQAMNAHVERAHDAETRALDAEQRARGAVTARKADAEVVSSDRDRWYEARRRKTEAQEEEAAEEAFRRKG